MTFPKSHSCQGRALALPVIDPPASKSKRYHPESNITQITISNRNTAVRRTASSGMLRRVALVRPDVSEELGASVIWVIRIGELGTTLSVN
jgi:hypothetical protein